MGLKPDKWIKKMALEQRMIEPFEEGQIRNGVISYGTQAAQRDRNPKTRTGSSHQRGNTTSCTGTA